MSKLILETIRNELKTCSVIDGEGEFVRRHIKWDIRLV
jgi:hypothetical protein